jgi:P4 family phage/plasmid primase-like protien
VTTPVPPDGQPAEVPTDPEGLGRNYNPLLDPVSSDADMATAVARALGSFRWAGGLGWLGYRRETGDWAPAPEETVSELVRRFMLGMSVVCGTQAAREIADGKDAKFYDELARTWRKQASASRIFAVTRLVRGIRYTDPSLFDAHPDLCNCPNGVLELITGNLLDHDPDYLFTKVAGARYVPGYRHPDIEMALEAIPADVRSYAQLRYGQGLTGHKPPDDVISFQHGSGENGKTTIMTAIKHAAGGYCEVLPAHLLLANPEAHTTDLMTLHGVRFGIIEELPEEHHLAVTRIKISTASRITARYVHKNNVTFSNGCSLFISTNYRPQVRETDHGTWRRLEGLIPYPYTFRKPHEPIRDHDDRRGDPTLRQRVEIDADGLRAQAMLAWLAEGARRWYAGEEGRKPWTMGEPPRRVLGEVAEWRESCDLLYGYFADHLEWEPGAHVVSSDLLAAFNAWLKGRGHQGWSGELFASRFGAHSVVREHRVGKKRVRLGGKDGAPSRPSGMYLDEVSNQYSAWLGVKVQDS